MSATGLVVIPVQAPFEQSSPSTEEIAWKVGSENGSGPFGGTTESSTSASTCWG